MSNKEQVYTAITPADLTAGQVVRLHEKIQDLSAKGEARERIQVFEGLILAVRGKGASKSFVIRKEADGYGVEKIFPVSSPNVAKLELVKVYKTRRAKLTFIKNFGRKLKEALAS